MQHGTRLQKIHTVVGPVAMQAGSRIVFLYERSFSHTVLVRYYNTAYSIVATVEVKLLHSVSSAPLSFSPSLSL
jgi:hypothetical protein